MASENRLARAAWVGTALAPALTLLVVTAYIPIVFALTLSLYYRTAFNPRLVWAGLDNFAWLIGSGRAMGRAVALARVHGRLGEPPDPRRPFLRPALERGDQGARHHAQPRDPALSPADDRDRPRLPLDHKSAIRGRESDPLDLGLVSQPINFFGGLKEAMPSVIVATAWQYGSFAALLIFARLRPSTRGSTRPRGPAGPGRGARSWT